MIDRGKLNVLGVLLNAVDAQAAIARIEAAALERKPLGVSALAVHGVMTGALDSTHRHRLNALELVVPDGQPVRWALNLLHHAGLSDRVAGPQLMLQTCALAEQLELPIYLYGSRTGVLERLATNLRRRFPGLTIAGAEPSRFRRLTPRERAEVITRIKASGARITFVGLGCPRQEIWTYEYREPLSMPVLAVGAAFDFHAGLLKLAPVSLQRLGLEWLFRLVQEPRRLWRRYVYLNPAYVALLVLQLLGLRHVDASETRTPLAEESFG